MSALKTGAFASAYDRLALSYTGYAIGTNSTWPFVTIRDFEAQGDQFIKQTGCKWLALTMLVSKKQRSRWESYSVKNDGWVNESFAFLGLTENNKSTISPFIFRRDDGMKAYYDNETDSTFTPCWQISPVNEGFSDINFNFRDSPLFESIYTTLVQGAPFAVSPPSGVSASLSWPQITLGQPVYDSVLGNQTLVAIIYAQLPMHIFFEGILATHVGGIDLVIKDTCGVNFTYLVKGPNVTFVGEGDLHDPQTSQFIVSTDRVITFTNGCGVYYEIYPSIELYQSSQSNTAVAFVIAVVALFISLGFVFYVYDVVVERRQKLVLLKAARSKNIVDSFFPSNIRDRIIDQKGDGSLTANSSGHQRTLRRDTFTSKPIADLHPNATVLFADIVNFTAWSSVREPSQVFTLLELVYNSFDKLGKQIG